MKQYDEKVNNIKREAQGRKCIMVIFIDVTSNEEVGGVRCAGPMSVAPSSELLLLFLRWWKWAKRGLNGESSLMVS